ncbi:hypothetical protein GPECTOR_7g1204 [Gonium pectorale]|uniref:Uncharacterized protein n=1 Tax=Gonium pectorale TaxID=33097 RepID=A0A150GVE1_GONPE|nr:hypothetical protein GPECTOR_7g1204 [Gonium pectorale]|eukprot:KXZ53310.1 hypothetical protein GPECTOR_7g1204 [Gonium pectorale]
MLRLGSSDTGDGVWLTDAAVLHIAEKCPNLVVLQLSACTGVTTRAFVAVTEKLSQLTELHDRSSGKLTAKALDPLLKAGALPKLQKLYITDQSGLGYELIQRLIKKRKGLRVLAGTTDSDSVAWGCVLSQMGADYGDGLYGNML